MPEALIAFAGVAVGVISTSLLTVYKERLTLRKERETRAEQRQQSRHDAREAFQRESLLALQQSVTDLIKSVYDEEDRMVITLAETSEWPARRWTTPTAQGWTDAELRLAQLQARIFDDELRRLSKQIRGAGRQAVWATTVAEGQEANEVLAGASDAFNDRVATILPALYRVDS